MTAMHSAVPVIVTPGAGGGHDEVDAQRIVSALGAAGVAAAVHSPRAGEDLGTLVARVMRDHPPVVIGGGGDGTISAVAAGLVGTDTALGVLPLGTLNHFARDLTIPLDLDGAARVIAAGHRATVDVGEVNGRVFVNNSSLGLYPEIVRDRELQRRRLGRGKWAALAWASITVLRRYPFLDVAMHIHGHSEARRTAFVFIGNNEYDMEGFDIGSRVRLDGGILSVYVTQRCGRAGLFLLALRALVGRLRQAKDLDALTCQTMTVETRPRRLRVANDGEVVMMDTPLRYRVRPGALNVLVAAPEPEAPPGGATS